MAHTQARGGMLPLRRMFRRLKQMAAVFLSKWYSIDQAPFFTFPRRALLPLLYLILGLFTGSDDANKQNNSGIQPLRRDRLIVSVDPPVIWIHGHDQSVPVEDMFIWLCQRKFSSGYFCW